MVVVTGTACVCTVIGATCTPCVCTTCIPCACKV